MAQQSLDHNLGQEHTEIHNGEWNVILYGVTPDSSSGRHAMTGSRQLSAVIMDAVLRPSGHGSHRAPVSLEPFDPNAGIDEFLGVRAYNEAHRRKSETT